MLMMTEIMLLVYEPTANLKKIQNKTNMIFFSSKL